MAKLNKDEVLRGLLQTLIDGWGRSAVEAAFNDLGSTAATPKRKAQKLAVQSHVLRAVDLVSGLHLSADRQVILAELARRFDEGDSFPTTGDVRSFLLAHHQNVADIKGRISGFKRMIPVLAAMSPKGLERLLSRSHHSGPAELSAISDAIQGAGRSLRGGGRYMAEPKGSPAPQDEEYEHQSDASQSRDRT